MRRRRRGPGCRFRHLSPRAGGGGGRRARGGGGGGRKRGGGGGGGGGGAAASLSLWARPLTRLAALRKGSAPKSTADQVQGRLSPRTRARWSKRHNLRSSPA